jgi:predicted dehydrogenase
MGGEIVRQIDIHPSGSKEPIRNGSHQIALVGVGAVVDRFYSQAFANIYDTFPHVTFKPVDTKTGVRSCSLPVADLSEVMHVNDFAMALHTSGIDGEQLKGAILAVPPRRHLALARFLLSHGLPVMLEKPLVMPHEVQRLVDLDAQYPGKLFAADFILDNVAVRYLVDNPDIFSGFGSVLKIESTIKEPWEVEKGREWLVDDGLGTDIIPHTHALAETIQGILGIGDEIVLDGVHRYKYISASGQEPSGANETYMHLTGKAGNVDVSIEGGKGLDSAFYGAKITFSEATVELCIGTEAYCPYILIRKNADPDNPILYNFPDSGMVGYEGTLKAFLMQTYGKIPDGPTRERRMEVAVKGLKLLQDAYQRNVPIKNHPIETYPDVPFPIDIHMSRLAKLRSTQR